MELLEKRVAREEFYSIKKDQASESNIGAEIDRNVYNYINEYAYLESLDTFLVSKSKFSRIRNCLKKTYKTIVHLKRVNGLKDIDSFMESVNSRLSIGGIFIGCAETLTLRHKRIKSKCKPPLKYIYCFFDYIFTNIFPFLPITRQIYLLATCGRNRALSKVELLGRLYRNGFEIMSEQTIEDLHYFVAKKIKKPIQKKAFPDAPIICLKRVGLHGKTVNIYKLRTMYAYSEYLQEYIYKMNSIENGGKFNNDYRITPLGKFLRRFWIDELPMLFNMLKGDMNLFGVRPLSRQYYSLYSEELQQERIKHRPGLIPPYYVDLPGNFEEIMESEMKYLKYHKKSPIKTNLLYLIIAFNNIVIKGIRSK